MPMLEALSIVEALMMAITALIARIS